MRRYRGTQGRVYYWFPERASQEKKQLPSSFHNLYVRFVKESSLGKSELLPDVDMMDIHPRQENLPCRGDPVLLQIPLVPAYALTVHKTQASPWPGAILMTLGNQLNLMRQSVRGGLG